MKLGIGTYSLSWSIGIPGYEVPKKSLTAIDLLNKAAAHNIKLVQIADNIALHSMAAGELEEIRKVSQSLGIVIEVGTRGSSPDHLIQYLEIAEFLNSNLVRTLITTEDIHQAADDISQVLSEFTKAGVILAVENHGMHTTQQLACLFDKVNSPYVGCCLDTVNSFGALECPKQVIDTLMPYVVNLHIKDFTISRVQHQMGYEILGAPAGYGRLDVPGLIESMKKHNKAPSVILEQWTPYTRTVQETIDLEQKWFQQSLDFLKKHFET